MLIVIEGIDGSGKATQTKLLVEHLRREHYPVETLDFPQYRANFFGRLARRYLDGEFGPPTAVNPYLASTLYALDRWESSSIIRQWLETGHAVILDRYVESNLIHQAAKVAAAEQAEFSAWLLTMEYQVLHLPKPDLPIFLHLPMQVAYQLLRPRNYSLDGHERELQHLEAAERMCLKLAQEHGWSTVECTDGGRLLPPEVIHQRVWESVRKKFGLPPDLSLSVK